MLGTLSVMLEPLSTFHLIKALLPASRSLATACQERKLMCFHYTEVVEAFVLKRLVDGRSGLELARLLSLVENK